MRNVSYRPTVGGNLKEQNNKRMEMKLIVIFLMMMTFNIIKGQDTLDIRYYKKETGGRPVLEKKGKYIETKILDADSTIRIELRNMEDSKLVLLKRFKNNTPIGKWILPNGKTVEFNNGIENMEDIEEIIRFDINEENVIGDIEGEFIAPIFPDYNNSFHRFIAKNLRYPSKAQEKRIQGKVISQVIIDENGNLTDLTILQSVNKILDDEAKRVIMLSPKWTPAKLDGKPVKVLILVPINFTLQ